MMKLNKKNKLLLVGFALALYISYVFAISKTFQYYSSYDTYKKNESMQRQIPKIEKQLHIKEKQLNHFLQQNNISNQAIQQNDLLKQLTLYTKTYNLRITDFKEPHIVTQNQATTTHYIFAVEGSFNSTLLLINKIEKTTRLGFVKHINFNKKNNFKTNSDYLITDIILEKK